MNPGDSNSIEQCPPFVSNEVAASNYAQALSAHQAAQLSSHHQLVGLGSRFTPILSQVAIPNSSAEMCEKLLSEKSSASRLSEQIPRTEGKTYEYGTAGFRGPADTLNSTCLRMGFLSAVRARTHPVGTNKRLRFGGTSAAESATTRYSPAVGCMITASHNPEDDNGVKIIEPMGEMLDMSWEDIAVQLANAGEKEVTAFLRKIGEDKGVDWSVTPRVFIGRDTRKTSNNLCNLLLRGAVALGSEVTDFGEVTTPQLHWVVREFNLGQEATVFAYYRTLSAAFLGLIAGYQLSELTLDCANGVGSKSLQHMMPLIASAINITGRNIGPEGLNENCGADYVQKNRMLPVNFSAEEDAGKKLASFDGDADRLVYYYTGPEGFKLLDGDKIIALYVQCISSLVELTGLDLSIGAVQTAYANGASTMYIQTQLGVPVQCAKTGVKHLHQLAAEKNIGIYFEANGHGTIVFSPKTVDHLNALIATTLSPDAKEAAQRLVWISHLVNQSVGDALSDLLMVEYALAQSGWTLKDWNAMYEDLPSRMLSVTVKDRSVIRTTNAERTCIKPEGLQARIDSLVSAEGSKVRRAFVRPSGTEDIVRVYAEAETQEIADQLAEDVGKAVTEFCS